MADACAPSYVLRLTGKKWTYRILRHLRTPARFGELEKHLPTITHHVLSEELHFLQAEGLIMHVQEHYSLTESGTHLLEAIDCLVRWAQEYREFSPCPQGQSCSSCARYHDGIVRGHGQVINGWARSISRGGIGLVEDKAQMNSPQAKARGIHQESMCNNSYPMAQ